MSSIAADIVRGTTYSAITERAVETLTLPGINGLHAPSTVEVRFWPLSRTYEQAKGTGLSTGLFKACARDWRRIGRASMSMVGTLFLRGEDALDATLLVTTCGHRIITSVYVH